MSGYKLIFKTPTALPAALCATEGVALAAALQRAALHLSVPTQLLRAIWSQPDTTVTCVVAKECCVMEFSLRFMAVHSFLTSKECETDVITPLYYKIRDAVYKTLKQGDTHFLSMKIFTDAFGDNVIIYPQCCVIQHIRVDTKDAAHLLAFRIQLQLQAALKVPGTLAPFQVVPIKIRYQVTETCITFEFTLSSLLKDTDDNKIEQDTLAFYIAVTQRFKETLPPSEAAGIL